MKTDELIHLLAADERPVQRSAIEQRFAVAGAVGIAGAGGLMLALFGGSLFAKQSLIERLARLQTPDLPPEGVRYTRRVTQIWCVFFVLNGSMAAALVLMRQYDWWALYTGIVSYVLMGLLLGGEWVYRKIVLKL